MKTRRSSITGKRECSSYAHKFNHGICTVCWAEHPAERASRIWNKRVRGYTGVVEVPPVLAYHTKPQSAADIHEAAGNKWAAELARIAARDGRAYRQFAAAVARESGKDHGGLDAAARVREVDAAMEVR